MKIKYLKSLLALAVSGALLYGCTDTDGTDTSSTATGTSTGVFVDAPVSGLSYSTPSVGSGVTDADGKFKYTGSDVVTFSVGSVVELGANKGQPIITPLVLMSKYDSNSIHVKAMASLLQSLDTDDKLNHIQLPSDFSDFADKLKAAGLDVPFKFANANVDQLNTFVTVLEDYVTNDSSPDTNFVALEDAYVQLAAGLLDADAVLMNVSKTPAGYSDKAGIQEIVTPNGTKALIMSYEDGTGDLGEPDAWSALSVDNGLTWKKTNLSDNGGDAIKVKNLDFKVDNGGPSMHVEGNYVLATWISTDCKKANPFNADTTYPDITPILDTDVTDPAAANADLFQVAGSQGIVSYSFGNVPFHCVWTNRGVLLDATDSEGGATAKLVWFKPEQLTSGRRDAKLDWPAGAENVAFGITFQEDPEGLEPGLGEGPGLGWSGATAHHKTDIWYSHINWADFEAIAENDTCTLNTDLEDNCHPIAKIRLQPPVRVSDNAACKSDKSGSGDGPLYCTATTALVDGGPVYCEEEVPILDVGTFCKSSYTNEVPATVGYPLDGNTAATRPNLHFAPTEFVDGNATNAVAMITYEETKGLCRELGEGNGCPDEPWLIGKHVIYHHFPFDTPDTVHHGYIVSQPVTEEQLYTGVDDIGVAYNWDLCSNIDVDEDLVKENGCYENARRERFTVNNDPTHNVKVAMIYKQGAFKQGERADIMMRRLVGTDFKSSNFTDNVCISCGTATEDGTTGDITMSYDADNLTDGTTTNILDDARSLRASLDENRLLVGFAWTPDWQKATTADPQGYYKDQYDFLVRRSFDAGENWEDEPPRNTSNLGLKSAKVSVVEPRIAPVEFVVGEALQKTFVVTYCTAENKVRIATTDGAPTHAPGLDCFYARTIDDGETYEGEVVDGITEFACLACGDTEQVEPEVFLTEDGNTMHSAWAQKGDFYIDPDDTNGGEMKNGSDVWYRQIGISTETTTTE